MLVNKDYGIWGVTPAGQEPEWIIKSTHKIIAYSDGNGVDFYEAQKGVITTPAKSVDEDGNPVSIPEIRTQTVFNSDLYYVVDSEDNVTQCEKSIDKITPEGRVVGVSGDMADDAYTHFHEVQGDPDAGNYVYAGETVKFVDLDLVKMIAVAKQQVISFANSITASILSQYPEAEQKLWSYFKEEAQKFDQTTLANNNVADFPNLVGMLDSRLGVATNDAEKLTRLQATVPSILTNAQNWSKIAEYVAGLRGRVFYQIESATSKDEISGVLTAAKTEAQAVAQQYGLI